MAVRYKGHDISVNEKLLTKNKAWGNLKRILNARRAIDLLLEKADILYSSGERDNSKFRDIAESITSVEFQLQKAWKFPLDKNYHTYFLKLPGCTCPKLDNSDNIGTSTRYIRDSCVYHSLQK